MNNCVEKSNMPKLTMADGTEVGTLEELREHFDLISLLEHYSSGALVRWLSVCYPEEAEIVESINNSRRTHNFEIKLCSVFHLEISLNDVLECYRQAAEIGNAEGQYRLGKCYMSGRGKAGYAIEKNMQRGLELLRKAAEQGHFNAQYLLSRDLCVHNFGIDEREALKWLRKVAEQGNCKAQYELGEAYMRGHGVDVDKREAVKWLLKAAEQGYSVAQHDLGYAYLHGNGVDIDEHEALKWFRAYSGDDSEAIYFLGREYHQSGENEKAFRYSKSAAAYGNTYARLNLYLFFKDEEETIRWFREAAENGDDEAAVILDSLEHMDDRDIDSIYWRGEAYWNDFYEEGAFLYYEIAANHGHPGAMCRLATFYMNGFAVEEDKEEALRWYRKAAENGDGLASDVLENWENIEWNTP